MPAFSATLFLVQIELIAPFANVGGKPIPLTQLADRRILVAGFSIVATASSSAPRRLGGRIASWTDAAVPSRAHASSQGPVVRRAHPQVLRALIEDPIARFPKSDPQLPQLALDLRADRTPVGRSIRPGRSDAPRRSHVVEAASGRGGPERLREQHLAFAGERDGLASDHWISLPTDRYYPGLQGGSGRPIAPT